MDGHKNLVAYNMVDGKQKKKSWGIKDLADDNIVVGNTLKNLKNTGENNDNPDIKRFELQPYDDMYKTITEYEYPESESESEEEEEDTMMELVKKMYHLTLSKWLCY